MNKWGYELIPVDEPEGTSSSRSSAYTDMLDEFRAGRSNRVLVEYGDRDGQAIYMGLRGAKKRDSRFADIGIRKSGSGEKARVFLERDES